VSDFGVNLSNELCEVTAFNSIHQVGYRRAHINQPWEASPSSKFPVYSVFGDGGISIRYEDGETCSLSHDRTTNGEKLSLSPRPKPSPPPLIIANPDFPKGLMRA